MTDTEITPKMVEVFFSWWVEDERLRKLTNAELVAECAKLDAADYAVVEEMMTRLDPKWFEEEA